MQSGISLPKDVTYFKAKNVRGCVKCCALGVSGSAYVSLGGGSKCVAVPRALAVRRSAKRCPKHLLRTDGKHGFYLLQLNFKRKQDGAKCKHTTSKPYLVTAYRLKANPAFCIRRRPRAPSQTTRFARAFEVRRASPARLRRAVVPES